MGEGSEDGSGPFPATGGIIPATQSKNGPIGRFVWSACRIEETD
jgi:hypothetical protein